MKSQYIHLGYRAFIYLDDDVLMPYEERYTASLDRGHPTEAHA